MIARLQRLFLEQRDPTLLGLVRIALALLLFRNTLGLAEELVRDGFFGDYFFLPLVSRAWVPNHTLYSVLLALKLAAAVLAVVGIFPRFGLFSAAVIGLYLITCDTLQYHNNRAATHLVALLVSFTPCDRSFLLISRRKLPRDAPSTGPFWAVHLAKLQLSLIYLASGGGKLFDADWRGGQVMLLRMISGLAVAARRGIHLPDALATLVSSPLFQSIASKLAISTELFLAIGLWLPRVRALALFVGVWFHLGIQASASVDLFSWLMLTGYILFVTPELRERTFVYDEGSRAGRIAARALPYLDWLLRLRVELAPASNANRSSFVVIDRRAREHSGISAFAELCRALPILFPIWLPVAVFARVVKFRAAAVRPATTQGS